jgi:hypothetical protein
MQTFEADAIDLCGDRHTYALNGGQLVYSNGDSDFDLLPNQPAFILRIACDREGTLHGVSSRFGAFSLDSPPGWPWRSAGMLLTPLF